MVPPDPSAERAAARSGMRNRLHAICPYFAMFPESFARQHIEAHTKKGELVFDCFSGRGTSLLEALLLDRRAAAVDINPVAYCVSGAKAAIPDLDHLIDEIDDLEAAYLRYSARSLEAERMALPPFFRRAFYHTTLREILFLRRALAWRRQKTHRFIAALALGALHGEKGKPMQYFSNQMPRTISTKPGYSLTYWRDNDEWAEKRDVFEILRRRADYRLSGDIPNRDGQAVLADARRAGARFEDLQGQVRACITSPPYYDVTSYEEDQWLRLWFLGQPPSPSKGQITRDDRHHRRADYVAFLKAVWHGIQPLMAPGAILVCRLGAKGISVESLVATLEETLRPAFPKLKRLGDPEVTELTKRQTDTFRPGSAGCLFEVDTVFATS
jgi:hypothetical protein